MAVVHLEIVCSRCGKLIHGMEFPKEKEEDLGFTSGYYPVGPGKGWSRYARPDEEYLCDSCMWADPDYQKDHPS